MTDEERWRHLCELAAKEQDPQKLIELTHEINSLLLLRKRRLDSGEGKPFPNSPDNASLEAHPRNK